MRVLFIGNSYTYYNDGIQNLVKKLSDAHFDDPHRCSDPNNPKRIVLVDSVLKGGKGLDYHWEEENHAAASKIQGEKWDVVVLQDHSKGPFEKNAEFVRYSKLFCDLVHQGGARPVFYLTWARLATPEKQTDLNKAYCKASIDNNAGVVPVGIAWDRIRKERPDLEPKLYIDDGHHPTPIGSYISGCVFFASLTGVNPEGKAFDFSRMKTVLNVIL